MPPIQVKKRQKKKRIGGEWQGKETVKSEDTKPQREMKERPKKKKNHNSTKKEEGVEWEEEVSGLGSAFFKLQ